MLRSSVRHGNAEPMAVQSRMLRELLRYVMRGGRGILMRRALGGARDFKTQISDVPFGICARFETDRHSLRMVDAVHEEACRWFASARVSRKLARFVGLNDFEIASANGVGHSRSPVLVPTSRLRFHVKHNRNSPMIKSIGKILSSKQICGRARRAGGLRQDQPSPPMTIRWTETTRWLGNSRVLRGLSCNSFKLRVFRPRYRFTKALGGSPSSPAICTTT